VHSKCLFCSWEGHWQMAYQHTFDECVFWANARATVRERAEGAWLRTLPHPMMLWAVMRAKPAMPHFEAAVAFGAQVDAEAAGRQRAIAAMPVPAG